MRPVRRTPLSEAVVRPDGRAPDVRPTPSVRTCPARTEETAAAVGIHAATLPPNQSGVRPPGQTKGPRGVISASQKKATLWSDLEIDELRRLCTTNIASNGNVMWNKVEDAWKELGLPPRSKAGLSSKWTAVKNNTQSTTPMTKDDNAQTSNSVEQSQSSELSSDVRPNEASPKDHADGPSPGVANPDVAKQPDPTPLVDITEEDITTIFQKHLKQARNIGCLPNMRKPPSKVSGRHIQPIVSKVDKLIEVEMNSRNRGSPTWNQLSIIAYAGALTVSQIGNRGSTEKVQRLKTWFKNTYREIESLRRTIGKASAELNRRKNIAEVAPTTQQAKNIRMLKRKYKAETHADITSLVERLKCRLQLLRSRIELRKADEKRKRVRQTPVKVLMRSMEVQDSKEAPDVHQIRNFWKDIVGVKKTFSPNEQLEAWRHSMQQLKGDDNPRESLTPELWQKVLRKAKPWKAHGPDGLQGYWWKAFPTISAALYRLILKHLTSGDPLPQKWIAEGRIILLHKSGSRSDPANFRPIACLNTCYKLLTGYIAAYLDQYVREREILPSEQIALRGGVWGCTHAHILDQTMTADAHDQKQRPISVAWIDYAKAFDSVPHSYIQWLFNAVQVPNSLKTFLTRLMTTWRVKYEVRSPTGGTERSSYLRIRSGVLQGDSFSPLLFCLAMAPISYAVKKTKGCYQMACGKQKMKTQTSLSHLFYMDDLKLFANSAESLSNQIKEVASISKAINMKLNVKKCARAHFIPKRMIEGQVGDAAEAAEQEDANLPVLQDNAVYKYLGIEQGLKVSGNEAWDRVETKAAAIAHKLWESDLTFGQKVNAYNTAVIPVLSYVTSCIIEGKGTYLSALKKGDKFDVKVRDKILVKLKARYAKACAVRTYIPAEQGGYGLKSARDAIEESTIYSWAYLCTKVELRSSLNLFVSMAQRQKRCVVSDALGVLKSYAINCGRQDIDVDHSTATVNGTQFNDAKTLARHVVSLMRTANNTRRCEEWLGKDRAGRVLRSDAGIDEQTSFLWLREGKLSSTAVRNVIATQEGCLWTRAVSNSATASCRACKKTTETPEHVVSNCSKWLPTLYIDRHDSVARNIHYKLCQKYDLTPPHYSQKVDPVLENERVKLYWNQPVQTKTIIRHNKPDLIAFDKVSLKATIIEVAVSWFTGIVKQMEIKRNRYCVNGNWDDEMKTPYPRGDNLLRELQTAGWQVSFLPVVIGATGEVPSGLKEQMQGILGLSTEATEKCIERLQRSAVLGTSRIIKNHLADRST